MDTSRYTQQEPRLTSNQRVAEHCSRSRAHRLDLLAPSTTRRACRRRVVDSGGVRVARIKVDDSLSQLFRSDTPEFKTFEEVTRRFPSNEFDVLIVVEGKGLLERASIEKLRDLVTDLQLVEGTRGIISLFSARQPPQSGELPAPLFPEQLPEGAEYDRLIQRVMNNEIIRGKLLSEDGELTLIVLALDPDVVASSRLRDVIANVQKAIDDDLAGSQLTARLSGVPVMQLEIRNAVERDRLFYNAFGFAAGCLIAIVFFRRLSFMVIGAGPPPIAIVLALSALSVGLIFASTCFST
jgi:predicted RND superfamily exporter protein